MFETEAFFNFCSTLKHKLWHFMNGINEKEKEEGEGLYNEIYKKSTQIK